MKHPIRDRRERLMALGRLIFKFVVIAHSPHVGFCSLHHHLPFRLKPAPRLCHSQLIFYIRRCVMYHVLSNLPFFANFSPISDKPLVRPLPRFHPYRVALRHAPGGGLSFVWAQNTTPAVCRTHCFGGPLEHTYDHFLVSRHPTNTTAQPVCVLFSTNGSSGRGLATTRPPYKPMARNGSEVDIKPIFRHFCLCFSVERRPDPKLDAE